MVEDLSNAVKCDASKTGICALHEVEIERRRNSDKAVDELEEKVGALFKRSAIVFNFIAAAKVVAAVAAIIWAGSFWYTHDHKQDSVREFAEVSIEMQTLRRDLNRDYDKISALQSDSKVKDEKFVQLLDKIGTNNRRLSDLIERLSEDKKLKVPYLR